MEKQQECVNMDAFAAKADSPRFQDKLVRWLARSMSRSDGFERNRDGMERFLVSLACAAGDEERKYNIYHVVALVDRLLSHAQGLIDLVPLEATPEEVALWVRSSVVPVAKRCLVDVLEEVSRCCNRDEFLKPSPYSDSIKVCTDESVQHALRTLPRCMSHFILLVQNNVELCSLIGEMAFSSLGGFV